jgi:hypothetical protein
VGITHQVPTIGIPAAAQREAHMMFAKNMKPEEILAVKKP